MNTNNVNQNYNPYAQNVQPTSQYGQPAPQHGQPAPQHGQPAPQHGQPVPPYGQPAPVSVPPAVKKPKRVFNTKETVFAWVCYILSYLFCLSIPIKSNPFGAFILIALMFVSTFIVMLIIGKKPKLMPVLVGLSALTVSAGLVTTVNRDIHFFAFCYSLIAYCYFLFGMSSDNRFRFSDAIVADFIKAIFIMPFVSFLSLFKVIFSGKNSKNGKVITKILLGVAVAIVPTIIVGVLLSYDDNFAKLIGEIFDITLLDIINHALSLGFGLVIGAYTYSIFVSASDNKCANVLTEESRKIRLTKIRIAPAVTVVTAVFPLLFIYVVFFISQWQYYISGFTGYLPKEFSYAEFARGGFSELCTVSAINLVVLILVSLFLRRKQDKKSATLVILSVVISLCTLVLISTAMAKMYMYIASYGLTPKRVYATWFMVVMAIIFILIILKQFISRLKLVALSLAVFVVMFGALALSGVDSFIAKYNVDRYVDGTLETVDIEAMEELGDAAVPQLVRLANVIKERENIDVMKDDLYDLEDDMYYDLYSAFTYNYGYHRAYDDDYSIWSFNIPSVNAQKALDSYLGSND